MLVDLVTCRAENLNDWTLFPKPLKTGNDAQEGPIGKYNLVLECILLVVKDQGLQFQHMSLI